ncbi:MAG: glycosyltransferase family 2 protein [Limisphaerales bacterium]
MAAEFGAKIFREPWKGQYRPNQSASEKATSDWLLALDADEVVSPELKAEIQDLFTQPEKAARFAAYDFPRCTLYYDKWIRHGEWYPDRKLRLWRRGQGHWAACFPMAKLSSPGKSDICAVIFCTTAWRVLNIKSAKVSATPMNSPKLIGNKGRRVTFLELLVRPPWRFFRGYFLKLGFLDGRRGLAIAWLAAFYTFLRYFKPLKRKTANHYLNESFTGQQPRTSFIIRAAHRRSPSCVA